MKTAYELAMERLNKNAPTAKLTEGQKRRIAGLESTCRARIAEHEIAFGDKIARAEAAGEFEMVDELKAELGREKRKLQEALEDKKERVRQGRK